MEKSTWKTYEEVANHLLDKFAETLGLQRVERKQRLQGASGTKWEIDAKGVREGGAGIILVECRRYSTSKLKQEAVAALAFRIMDTGAKGGINPMGRQKGADLVAKHANIVHAVVAPNCTTEEYVLEFLDRVFSGLTAKVTFKPTLDIVVRDKDGNVIEQRYDVGT